MNRCVILPHMANEFFMLTGQSKSGRVSQTTNEQEAIVNHPIIV